MRTHVNPRGDAKNMVMVVSEDDGFSWTPPKWTNIWGYPAEMIALQDGRYLMVYGYRRPPYGMRGCISEDGVTWDVKNEFVIREGGVPGKSETERPGSSRMTPGQRQVRQRRASTGATRASTSTSAIRACVQMRRRHRRRLLSRMERGRAAAAICALHPLPARRLSPAPAAADAAHRSSCATRMATAPIRISSARRRAAGGVQLGAARGLRAAPAGGSALPEPAAAVGGRGADLAAPRSWRLPMAGAGRVRRPDRPRGRRG